MTDTGLAMLAPVYIGMPLGSLVAVHATAGREAVLVLIATIAISDTAQYYTGRGFGPQERERLAVATLVGSIAWTIIIWVVGYLFMGGPR